MESIISIDGKLLIKFALASFNRTARGSGAITHLESPSYAQVLDQISTNTPHLVLDMKRNHT
ncbi:MAG: hypothetical protein H0V62_12240 [Gammaproteobacteria bacterium]|nr:hypothetical protein [Gammaproteobacteria bacterium]